MGCRDCPRCTESCLASLVMLPFRLTVFWLLFGWVGWLIRSRCPQCGHKLSIHQRVGGRFVD